LGRLTSPMARSGRIGSSISRKAPSTSTRAQARAHIPLPSGPTSSCSALICSLWTECPAIPMRSMRRLRGHSFSVEH
jgi:hypothetical protein